MKVVKLSVCIATLNRAHYLDQTLDSIISGASEEVEIVILDGGSVDATEEVVHRHRKSFPRIRYYRQEKAMGVDRDFNAAVERAEGEYCWLLSDDDPIKPGAISAVLAGINQSPSLMIINAEVRNSDLSQLLEKKRMRIRDDRCYPPSCFEELFVDTAGYLSFIGGVIIRRDLWLIREREQYFGTEFAHIGVIFQKPLPGNALVIAEPLISIRYGVAQWTARGFDIWMFKWPDLIWSFPGFSDSAKSRVTPREPWRVLKTLLTFRAMGAYSLVEFHNSISGRAGQGVHHLIPRVVAVLPGITINTLGILYYSLFHRHALMPLVDLMNSRFYVMNWLRRTTR